eukprot:scaffold672_cov126-Cylindrotheca_fusiformis.AAC.40
MASTPPPPPPDENNWRKTVLQSYRNTEAREIAKTLAELEPGASTSSKLSLAMRFENTVFQAADSLEDYRKRLNKRLKKLRKNYKPTAAAAATAPQDNSAREILFRELQQKYGESLRYIHKNAEAAVQDVLKRHGHAKATQLQQHTDSAKAWAKELLGLTSPPPKEGETINQEDIATNEKNHRLKADVSEAHLQRLQHHLEKRLDNIRQYVVKHADPDLFLQETLERKDHDLKPRASDILSTNLTKRMEQLANSKGAATDSTTTATAAANSKDGQQQQQQPSQKPAELKGLALLLDSLEKAHAPVPAPTRNNSNDIPAALLHIDKMRAASTAFLTYMALKDRKETAPRQTLRKTHTIMQEGTAFIQEVVKKRGLNDNSNNKGTPKLQDAWAKLMELPRTDVDLSAAVAASPTEGSLSATALSSPAGSPPPAKRQRRVPNHFATKSKVLFRPKRRTPPNLIPALQRKRATLVRPEPDGLGSHLILNFESFTMTIYFHPLLVTLRATEPKSSAGEDARTLLPRFHTVPNTKCATWTPLHHGLTNRPDLSVWGVENKSYQSVGTVVEERLRDASTQATQVLRTCFGSHVKDKTQEVEVELLEGSALLEFLQIARTTYMPTWQDDDTVNY